MTSEAKSFYKSVGVLVLPLALQNLISVGVSSADVVMLGALGEDVLSGASLGGQVNFILSLIFFGITSGAAVLAAQYWGKRDTASIEKILGIAMRFSLLFGVVFTLAVQLFPYQTMQIFSHEPAVIEEGVKYLRIVSFSYIFFALSITYFNVIRSIERVLISTLVQATTLVLNIFLNWIFIFGEFGVPAMGVRGAALATLIVRIVECGIMLIYAYRFNDVVRLRPKYLFTHDKLLFKDFIRYSSPVILNELLWGSASAMNAVVIGHLGSAASAANSVAQVARQLSQVAGFGIAAAAAIMLGKLIGAGEEKKAEDYSKRFLRLVIVCGILGGALMYAVKPIALAIMDFTDVSAGYLSFMMFVMSYFVLAQSFNTTIVVGISRAGGDTRFGLALDVGTMWFITIPLGALAAFVFHWSVYAVYAILMADEIIKIPICIWRYRKKYWLRKVTRDFSQEMQNG